MASTWIIEIGDMQLHVRGFENKRVRSMAKVVVDGHRIIGVNGRGELFCNLVRGGNAFYSRPDRRCLGVLKAAIQLGVLSDAAVREAVAAKQQMQEARERKWAAEELESAAKSFGCALPSKVQKQIASAKSAA